MGEKKAKGVSDSKTRGKPLKNKDALGEGEAGKNRRQKRFYFKQKLAGLRRNSGKCMTVPRRKKKMEFGVKFAQKENVKLVSAKKKTTYYSKILKCILIYIHITKIITNHYQNIIILVLTNFLLVFLSYRIFNTINPLSKLLLINQEHAFQSMF